MYEDFGHGTLTACAAQGDPMVSRPTSGGVAPRIPDKTPLEEIELLDVSKASRLCGIKRAFIAEAMDRYRATKGRMGLPFIILQGTKRRRVRRASLRRYFEELERRAIYS